MQFDVITVDPPWPEKKNANNRMGDAGSHWDFLSLDDLISIRIERVMADPCALLLWTTYRHIPMALAMVQGWSAWLPPHREFRLIGRAFTWIKINSGMALLPQHKLMSMIDREGVLGFLERMTVYGTGYYTAGNDEVCLLYMSGKRAVPVIDKSVRSIGCLPRPKGRTFSAKPDEFRDRTVRIFGKNARYLELFATKEYRQDGLIWSNQGAMVDGQDIRPAVAALGAENSGE